MELKTTTFLAQDAQKQMNTLRHLVFHNILTLDSAKNTLMWWSEQKAIPLMKRKNAFFLPATAHHLEAADHRYSVERKLSPA